MSPHSPKIGDGQVIFLIAVATRGLTFQRGTATFLKIGGEKRPTIMLKKIFLTITAALLIFIGIILFRTFTYGAAPTASDTVALPDAPEISAETAAQNLSRAIQFETITYASGDPTAGNEGPWIELQTWLAETYPAIHAVAPPELVPGTLTQLYTWQGSNSALDPILLMAHQDVVPVNAGTQSDWEGAPFGGEVKNGYIYGRGAIDDKGNLIGIMEAVEALTKSGFKPQRSIILMFGHDEEVSGSGAEAGIALLKSRGIRPEMALDEGFMVIDPSPLTGKPMGFIGVSEKGYITLKVTALAEGGHSSTPPRNSATVRLSQAVVALDENQMPSYIGEPPVSDLFASTADDMPFMQKMAFANLWLFNKQVESSMADIPAANAMIRTTTAPTMLEGSAKENVLAQRAEATVNFRIHPNDTPESVLAHAKAVTSHIEGLEIAVGDEGIGSNASPISPSDNRAYRVLASVATETGSGAPVAPSLVLGATDARYASAITDSVYRFAPAVLSPEDLTGFHGTNERISVENMGRLSKGYAQIILAMDPPEE
jgi:carboxypeptidase PM20D1